MQMSEKAKVAPRRRPTPDERIDESLDESFPASDPPAHSGVVPGGPRRDEDMAQDKDKDKGKS
jgi:hypothetical protein